MRRTAKLDYMCEAVNGISVIMHVSAQAARAVKHGQQVSFDDLMLINRRSKRIVTVLNRVLDAENRDRVK